MNLSEFENFILTSTNASSIVRVELIQNLWSNYGAIVRIHLKGSTNKTVIAKHIDLTPTQSHPRGWNTNLSHQRKIKSYQIECNWYINWANQCNSSCYVPNYLGHQCVGNKTLLLLEDLRQVGFSLEQTQLSVNQSLVVLSWLANFHALFMNQEPKDLWETGTYWHLDTRPDEYRKMATGPLKKSAKTIDEALKNCPFQTLVHGDAKLANFCFTTDMRSVAAVDFQYVGGGCGIKDVVYFLGSCLSEQDCANNEDLLLNHYFKELTAALKIHQPTIDAKKIEEAYRKLYAIAWADFSRFLLGWMPTHKKLNGYSDLLVKRALGEMNLTY